MPGRGFEIAIVLCAMTKRIATAIVLGACLVTAQAFAQTTRTESIIQEKDEKAANLQPEEREKGDVIVTKLEHVFNPPPPAVRPTLGNFRPGAGLAAGVEYAAPAGDGALWTTSAAWSIKNFKQAEGRFDLPPAAGDRLRMSTFVRWNDAPDLEFFGLGKNTAQADEVSYALRTTEAGAEVQGRSVHWFRYGAGAAYLNARSGSTVAWLHSSAYAAIDTRESPGYTTRGGLYGLTFHHYADLGGSSTFDRTEIDLRQFIPVLHDNWIIALQGRADLTNPAGGQAIPFFMLPSIGGRDTLPGFEEYRFTDRDSLLLRSELRWTASPFVDMAVFYNQGTVAPSISDLDLHGLKHAWGFGARLHSSTTTALRLEVTHSSEGWGYVIGHSVSF